MILLSAAGRDRLSVLVTQDAPEEVRTVLRSLLGTRESRKSPGYGFFLAVHDFPLLKERLDRLGLVNDREIDEDAAGMIRSYQGNLMLNEQIKAGEMNAEIEPVLGALKSQLWTDQVSDVRFCLRHLAAGNFGEMGIGKSLCALATFVALQARGLARYGLVVCPNAVKQNWMRQTRQHTHLTIAELGNGKQENLDRLAAHAKARTDLCVIHYEALRIDEVRDRLVELPFDLVVADECHRVKHLSTSIAQSLFDALERIRPAVPLIEADVELPDGTLVQAVLPTGAKVGDIVDFW